MGVGVSADGDVWVADGSGDQLLHFPGGRIKDGRIVKVKGLDIVQTGRTLVENGLVEIEILAEVAPCLVVNRASYQRHRALLNEWISRLEAAEVVS